MSRIKHTLAAMLVMSAIGAGAAEARAIRPANQAETYQNGNNNAAGVTQQGSGHWGGVAQSGDANVGVLRQFGRNNDGAIVQDGNANTACYAQAGTNLSGQLNQTGDGNTMGVIQNRNGVREVPVAVCMNGRVFRGAFIGSAATNTRGPARPTAETLRHR